MAEEIKYKNIIGTGLTDYVQEQINHRKKVTRGNEDTNRRSSKELQWLTNRNAWFRLSSGAKFNPSPNTVRYKEEKLNTNNLALGNIIDFGSVLNPVPEDVLKLSEGYTDDLAKKYILQGGTLKNGKIRTTFKDTYPKGNYDSDNNFLGTESSIKGIKDDLGYKPLPGITNVSVGTRGKWRTTLEADVDFVCYNLEQLEIMNKLYMSLGVHVFLEWGHTPYINSSGNIIESFDPINFFDNNFKDKKKLIQEIEKKKKEHHGNYGALLGRVFNFTYSSNPDGSYNCKAQIIGPGAILESIRVNRATMYDFDRTSDENESEKFDSDLANALTSIKNLLFRSGIAVSDLSPGVVIGQDGLRSSVGETGKNGFGVLNKDKFFQNITDFTNFERKELNYGNLLTNIYESCTYKGYTFNKEDGTISYPNDFAEYGNAWQYVSNLSTDNLTSLPFDFFYGYSTRFSKGGKNTKTLFGINQDPVSEYQYITFGHLLALIQHVCIFTETKEGYINITPNSSLTNDSSPIVYLDFHPDNTIMKTGVLEASSDPSVCLVPLKINTKGNESPNEAFDKFFTPLDTRKDTPYIWQGNPSGFKSNESKNLVVNKSLNKINPVLKDFTSGKLMKVLISLEFAITTLKDLENQNQEVDLLSYINALLDGINISLGKINNFRAFFDDCSNVVRIIDEHKTENFEKELLTIPNFGLNSITYDYSFSSNIDPKIAAKVVIAAQGQNGGIKDFSEDVLTYQRLNIDVRDKFASQIIPALLPSNNTQVQKKIEQEKVAQKLFDHLYKIYSLDELVDPSTMNNLLKTFNDTSNIQQKYYKDKNSTLLIPLDISLKIDGITGILPYNAFLLPENRLPLRYQNSNVAFIIFSIDHEFESNQWNTILKGQLIYRNGVDINDNRPKRSGIDLPPSTTRNSEQPRESTTYGGKITPLFPQGDFTQPPASKAQPEPEDTTTTITEERDNLPPTGDSRQSFTPLQVDPEPTRLPDDVIRARDFISVHENVIKETYGAYEDVDFTVASGKTLRIGFGSDTITSPGGSVRKVKADDEITKDQAYADLERRIKTEFKPKVVATCEANGVNYDSLPPTVKTVFIDCAYNYGSLWNSIVISYRDGGVDGLKAELQRRADRGESQVPDRRIEEIKHLGG